MYSSSRLSCSSWWKSPMFHHATLQHHYAIIYIVWMLTTKFHSSFLFFMLETIFHWESKNLKLWPFLFKTIHLVFFLRGLKGHELFMDKMVSNGIQWSMPSRCGHIYVLSCVLYSWTQHSITLLFRYIGIDNATTVID